MKAIIDPRGGDVEDDASKHETSFAAITCRQIAGGDQSSQVNPVVDNAVHCSRSVARTDTAGCFGLGKYGFAQNHILSAGILACIATRNGDRRWIVRNAGAVSHSRKQFLVVEFACHRTDLRGLPRGIAAPRGKDFAIGD
jgi:hypothetical protein